MPKAEVGSTKHLANKMKSKGLQRLRWYCQVCEKQCRDENGFKCHTMSESHVRAMQTVGADPRSAIADFSQQFQRDFLLQLRTAHGTKPILINHFYQEYIAHKEHVHMNATRWPSLTEFAKFLGREGICRVEEAEKGLTVAWIDNSPEALRRQAAIQKRERMDKGDEEREQRLLREQIARAQADADATAQAAADDDDEARQLKRVDGDKISLSFGIKAQAPSKQAPPTPPRTESTGSDTDADKDPHTASTSPPAPVPTPAPVSLSFKPTTAAKPRNVFAAANKKSSSSNPLSSSSSSHKPSSTTTVEHPKAMSNAERIMKEEMERREKRKPSGSGIGFAFGSAAKKQRV